MTMTVVMVVLTPVVVGAAELEDDPRRLPKIEAKEAGFSVRRWTVDDGLPRQRVSSVAQTPDGYVWCGTRDGLVRFDGVHFRILYSSEVEALNGLAIHGLRCDREGRLWISVGDGGLVVLEEGRFRRMRVGEAGLPEPPRIALEGVDEDLWFCSIRERVCHRFDGRRFMVEGEIGRTGGIPAGWQISSVWRDASGPRWALVDAPLQFAEDGEQVLDRHLFRLDGERAERNSVDGTGPDYEPHLFYTSPDGVPGLVSRDGVYGNAGGRWTLLKRFDQPIKKGHGGPQQVHCDQEGNHWIGTYYGGLVLCSPDGVIRQFSLPGESRRPTVLGMTADQGGDLWVATEDGLYQIRRLLVGSWGVAEGIPSNGVNAIATDQDGTWLAVDHALVRLEDGHVSGDPIVPPEDYRDHGVVIERLCSAADGSLWVGLRRFLKETQGWNYELWHLAKGDFRMATNIAGELYAMMELEDGGLLLGTGRGVLAWRNGVLEPMVLPGLDPARGERAVVQDLARDRQGRVVAAVLTAGLYRLEDEGWRRLPPGGAFAESENSLREVRSLAIDSEGSIWAGCGNAGLGYWSEGRWRSLGRLAGVVPRAVSGIACDDRDGLWMTAITDEGVLRFSCAELRKVEAPFADVGWSRFDRGDGFPSIVAQSNLSPICKDSKGQLWFSTSQGAAMLDPSRWESQRDAEGTPQIHIQEVHVNDLLVRDIVSGNGWGDPIVVSPGRRRIEFSYTATDHSSPEDVRYRYRLEGYEDEWVDAKERKVAVYPDLPPGRYQFRVAVATKFGSWAEDDAAVELVIEPKWWERSSTKGLAVILLGALGWLLYVSRLRRVKERSRLQEAFSRQLIRSQEQERTRLASELHDGLGHELLVLKGGIDREVGERTGSPHQLSVKAGEVIQQVREISHDLRPPELERFGLGPALEAICQQTAEATGIELRVDLDELKARLLPEAEISLFRIAQEALSNMARHSDASEGSVSLKNGGEQIRLTIEDDGRGFELSALNGEGGAGGIGLSGMEERARLLGGSVEFVSRRRGGARVIAKLPLCYRS